MRIVVSGVMIVQRNLVSGKVGDLTFEYGDPDAPTEYAFHRHSESPVK
jgi:hypothetical protein